jgi:hypothetical protein
VVLFSTPTYVADTGGIALGMDGNLCFTEVIRVEL